MGGKALLYAFGVAIAGYLPAVAAYDRLMAWIRPMRHAEETMGRGLEAIFFGGPIVALAVASVTGWRIYRSPGPRVNWFAIATIAGLAGLSAVLAI
jgi:hypothetical protein